MIVACGSLWRSPGSIRIDRCLLLGSLKVRMYGTTVCKIMSSSESTCIVSMTTRMVCLSVCRDMAGELAAGSAGVGAQLLSHHIRERRGLR